MTKLSIEFRNGTTKEHYVSGEDLFRFSDLPRFAFKIQDEFVFVEDLEYNSVAYNVNEIVSMELENEQIEDVD